jgi:hypothetical protein
MLVPPQLPSYQIQLALLPKVPPFRVKVTTAPFGQIESSEDVTELAAVEDIFTLIVLFTQTVLLQIPSALTK